jgi:hypothetical protein
VQTEPALGFAPRVANWRADYIILCTGAFTAKPLVDTAPTDKKPQVSGRLVAAGADLTAHWSAAIDMYLPCSWGVTISVITTYVAVTRPLPPTPCTHLPTSNKDTLLSNDAMIVLIVESEKAARRGDFWPLMCEKDAYSSPRARIDRSLKSVSSDIDFLS